MIVINSIDYSADGLTMITSSDDDSIFIYSMQTGTRTRNVNSKKYGVDLIRFSHNTSNAIHCSTKVDDTIRYLSLHDNKYIRYFPGHTKNIRRVLALILRVMCLSMNPTDDTFLSDTIRYLSLHDNKYIRYFPGHTKKVMCLSMNPTDDTFLSGSLDKTIRLWDLRSQNCQGLMQVNGKAIAAFDPEGLIFAAGINNEQVKLYDLRSFDKGPFTTFKLEAERSCEWSGMTFSPCGKYIMINTNGTVIRHTVETKLSFSFMVAQIANAAVVNSDQCERERRYLLRVLFFHTHLETTFRHTLVFLGQANAQNLMEEEVSNSMSAILKRTVFFAQNNGLEFVRFLIK
ncbi:unnamed protein product [Strongylus vulgaris]|uniref:Uncharacterized protein n=1 Tax=Strongylus vulgaris TaxID=40348 RepID=A0A3P7LLH5_STRVU|nr:unnamed protein product [Strongylus vulgaris]